MSNVEKTFKLFIETLSLEGMDVDDFRYEDLYEKECQIFVMFEDFTKEDHDEYRRLVSNHYGKTVEEFYGKDPE